MVTSFFEVGRHQASPGGSVAAGGQDRPSRRVSMRRPTTLALLGLLALPLSAAAETWTNVPVVDGLCLDKVKADPDKHTKGCALQCAKGGYGLLTSDGKYLKFDSAGNEKALAAL